MYRRKTHWKSWGKKTTWITWIMNKQTRKWIGLLSWKRIMRRSSLRYMKTRTLSRVRVCQIHRMTSNLWKINFKSQRLDMRPKIWIFWSSSHISCKTSVASPWQSAHSNVVVITLVVNSETWTTSATIWLLSALKFHSNATAVSEKTFLPEKEQKVWSISRILYANSSISASSRQGTSTSSWKGFKAPIMSQIHP